MSEEYIEIADLIVRAWHNKVPPSQDRKEKLILAKAVKSLQSKLTALEGRLKKAASDGADYLGLYNAETLRVKALEGEKERLEKQIADAMVYCPACTESAGGHREVKHLPPVCGSEQAKAKLLKQVEGYKEDDFELRCMVAIAFSGSKLYTDDGELQDASEVPFIDYKRDTVSEIHDKIFQRRQPEIKAAFEEVMRKQALNQDTEKLVCPNCGISMPAGCGGTFKSDGSACWLNKT